LAITTTLTNRVFGAFTDIPWETKSATKANQGNSFVFKFDENESLTIYKHQNGDEVWHPGGKNANHYAFTMDSRPYMISGHKKADASLSSRF